MMNRFLVVSGLLGIALIVMACVRKSTSVVERSLTSEEKIKNVGTSYFKGTYQLLYNPSEKVVCLYQEKRTRPNEVFPTISFIVYDPTTEEVLFEDTVARAKMKWINDEQLQVQTVPGRVRSERDARSGFIYDLQSRLRKRM